MITGLESAIEKIKRATVHLREINAAVRRVASTADSYRLSKDADGNEVIEFLVQPPPDVSILAGEVVYQLRSALDHLAFELVKLNRTGIKLPFKWEKHCSFPLWMTIPNSQIKCGHTVPPLPYNCFNDALPGISKEAFAFIELHQPYRQGPGHHNAMRILAELSNIDRHRHLTPILPRIAVHRHFKYANGAGGTSTIGGLKHGAKIDALTIHPQEETPVDVQQSFSRYVTFEEIAVGAGPDTLEVQNVLEVCLQTTMDVIIPAFTRFLKNP